MARLVCRAVSCAGAKPELDQLTPTEQKMLLEFMLYTMKSEQREAMMVNHPRLYNVLYPGTLKIRVSTAGSDSNESRVICEE